MCRREKQLKEIADKGFFIMLDGTKSSDHEAPAKKKKRGMRGVSKTEEKVSKKRQSSKTMAKKSMKE